MTVLYYLNVKFKSLILNIYRPGNVARNGDVDRSNTNTICTMAAVTTATSAADSSNSAMSLKSRHPKSSRDKCEQTVRHYQSKFPSVPALRSEDFLRQPSKPNCNPTKEMSLLLDVRSRPERSTSMIAGAQSLEEFERDHREELSRGEIHQPVVTYCTMGYRSGMEAARLKRRYPRLQVYNLDGIVAYTYAVRKKNPDSTGLVDPQTNQATNRVHVFGSMWNWVDPQVYEARAFALPVLLVRLLQVGGLSVLRTVQSVVYCATKYFQV